MAPFTLSYRIETKPNVKPYVRYYEATLEAHSKDELKQMMQHVYNFHKDNANVFFMNYSVVETDYDLFEIGLLANLDGQFVPAK